MTDNDRFQLAFEALHLFAGRLNDLRRDLSVFALQLGDIELAASLGNGEAEREIEAQRQADDAQEEERERRRRQRREAVKALLVEALEPAAAEMRDGEGVRIDVGGECLFLNSKGVHGSDWDDIPF